MSHSEKLIDSDKHFVINDITRKIKNQANAKETLMQYDHNSERITFSIPRYIEGHDISECNKAEVHYINIDSKTKAVIKGRYDIMDFRIDETDETKMLCSWVISNNATKYVGRLNFLLRLSCVQENGTIDYAWNTKIYTSLMVSEGIYNTDDIKEEYADVLEQWKAEINTGLLNKVDKEDGKGLSTNDFTDNLKEQLESMAVANLGYISPDEYIEILKDYTTSGIWVSYTEKAPLGNKIGGLPIMLYVDALPFTMTTGGIIATQYLINLGEKTVTKRTYFKEHTFDLDGYGTYENKWSDFETYAYLSDENFTTELKNKLNALPTNENLSKIYATKAELTEAIGEALEGEY